MAFTFPEDSPLAFLLIGGGLPIPAYFGKGGIVKPENISYQRPVRVSVTNTEGSAFNDDFFEGVGRLSIAGNTGWKGPLSIPGWGLAMFKLLEGLFITYEARKQGASQLGLDPGTINLLFFDTINLEACLVQPTEFVGTMSRDRSQLHYYRMSFVILSDLFSDLIALLEINDPLQFVSNLGNFAGAGTAALTSINQIVSSLTSLASTFGNLAGSIL